MRLVVLRDREWVGVLWVTQNKSERKAVSKMMLAIVLLLVLVALLSGGADAALVQLSVERTVDIRYSFADVSIKAELTNTGTQVESQYVLALSPTMYVGLSYCSKDYVVVDGPGVEQEAEAGTVFLAFPFKKPLRSNTKAIFSLLCSYNNVLESFPAEIQQKESHYVRFMDNLYLYSPYATEWQATVVRASNNVEVIVPKSGVQTGEQIAFGPYMNQAPYSYKKLVVHYKNANKFATMTFMNKDIEVSHWGNVAVEEKYELRNTAARLKGSFSRKDYEMMETGSSFAELKAVLPANAYGVYYRDGIGNVSTSHVRTQLQDTVLEVMPRYPLFGGWKCDFYMGYNAPAEDFLSVETATGRYVLEIEFGSPFERMVVDDAAVRVVLPEGATDIKWTTPFPVDSVEEGNFKTYLDTVGRPTITLRRKNINHHHSAKFMVSYSFGGFGIYRELVMIIGFLFSFFLLTIGLKMASSQFAIENSAADDNKVKRE
jgi:oligosaccharyltransferase complex subunit alpha (ribophorin I)